MARPPPTPRQWRVVFIVGAGNSAGQAAVHLARSAASVTLLVRGERLAASMSDYLLRELEDARNIRIRLRTAVVNGSGSARLTGLTLRDNTRSTREEVPADALYVMIGAKPHTDWLAGPRSRRAGLHRDRRRRAATGCSRVAARSAAYAARDQSPGSLPLAMSARVPSSASPRRSAVGASPCSLRTSASPNPHDSAGTRSQRSLNEMLS